MTVTCSSDSKVRASSGELVGWMYCTVLYCILHKVGVEEEEGEHRPQTSHALTAKIGEGEVWQGGRRKYLTNKVMNEWTWHASPLPIAGI
jgi:hypothetical protein